MHRLQSKGRSLGKFQVEQSQIASGQVCTTQSQAGKHSQNKHRRKEVATSVSFKIDFGVPFQLYYVSHYVVLPCQICLLQNTSYIG